jgi:hypothetical protein
MPGELYGSKTDALHITRIDLINVRSEKDKP